MKNSEFAYWLQGFFEITEAAKQEVTLSPEQVKIIRQHLALAKKVENALDDFGNWLEGIFDLLALDPKAFLMHGDPVKVDPSPEAMRIPPSFIKLIRDRLNAHFAHVLDARFPNREELQRIHDGKFNSSYKEVGANLPATRPSNLPGNIEFMC